jgi:hypothetical protein
VFPIYHYLQENIITTREEKISAKPLLITANQNKTRTEIPKMKKRQPPPQVWFLLGSEEILERDHRVSRVGLW